MNPSELPVPVTGDQVFFHVIAALLVEQNAMIAELLDRLGDAPAVAEAPSPEPAPSGPEPPDEAPEPVSDPARVEVVPVAIREPVGSPPPQVGRGSSRTVWAAYATGNGIPVDDTTSRDQIITACQQAGIPT